VREVEVNECFISPSPACIYHEAYAFHSVRKSPAPSPLLVDTTPFGCYHRSARSRQSRLSESKYEPIALSLTRDRSSASLSRAAGPSPVDALAAPGLARLEDWSSLRLCNGGSFWVCYWSSHGQRGEETEHDGGDLHGCECWEWSATRKLDLRARSAAITTRLLTGLVSKIG